MQDAIITYEAPTSEFQFAPFEVTVDQSPAKRVALAPLPGRRMQLAAFLEGIASLEESRRVAYSTVVRIVNRFTFLQDVSIGDPVFSDALLTDPQTGEFPAKIGTMSGLVKLAAQCDRVLTAAEVDSLGAQLSKPRLPGEHLYRLFRAARDHRDVATHFLALYHILLYVNQDDSARVEAALSEASAETSSTNASDASNSTDDCTQLRADFLQNGGGSGPNSTVRKMQQQLPRLNQVARQMIASLPVAGIASEADDAA